MRLIDADELITAFPCGESVRTESVRATIKNMSTIKANDKAECDNCIWNVCNYNKIDWEVSEDCISREYLLSKVYDMDNDDLVVDYKDIVNAPSVVPTTEQSSRVGRWEHYMGDLWTCTYCGESLMCDDIECNIYCPSCGAYMK